MSLLEVYAISKKEEETVTLKDVSFSQQQFQKIAIAGATGSGKTTLLKIIAGLVQPSEGEVLYKGLRVKGPQEKLIPGYAFIPYLSQHFELRNHYRVKDILEMANQIGEEQALSIFEVCRIDHLLQRWTHQLSGGEKQRIALARVLVSAPQLILLDEPYSNLDAIHKNILKTVLNDIIEHLKITCLLVSHDPIDILPWADEIIVLEEGRIIQQDAPVNLYKTPINEYTAALFGRYTLMSPALAKSFSFYTDIEMNKINNFFRPEDFKISLNNNEGVKGEVVAAHFMGSHYELEINISGNLITANNNSTLKKRDVVYVSIIE